MVGVYLALGLLFLFTDIAVNIFPANRTPIGIVFIVYGIFRSFITVRKIRRLNKEDEV
jgi:hypothetical protein